MTSKLYLDSCIFISYIHKKHKNSSIVISCIKALEQYDVEVYSSDWALIESIKVLIRDYSYDNKNAEGLVNNFKDKSKIGNIKINFVDINTTKECNFQEFFDYLKNQMIGVKELHLADAIHSLIMVNNGIANILTTDEQFNVLEKITCVNPKVFEVMKPKTK